MTDLDRLSIATIRTLAMDAVQKANSGHPGAPMGLAPVGYLLWTRFLKHNPANPGWVDRDRFVLSAGHASMLLYALLHLTGYDLLLEELQQFRQWGSRTPGHPEFGHTPGVETTTGPLGQGLMNAVGMAMAEAHLAAVHNRPGFSVINHHTWVICGDGDLMEGASQEAASLAGHLGLGKLICIYDDNRITIEGGTDLAFTEDVGSRFRACGWQVIDVGDAAEDLESIELALYEAMADSARPSLVMVRTHIGFGSPNRQDTSSAHGEPLGMEEVRLSKRSYCWPEDAQFLVPDEVRAIAVATRNQGAERESGWRELFAGYRREYPEQADLLETALSGKLPEGWESRLPTFAHADGPMATRVASGKVLNALAQAVPWLVGGSADLAPSTKTLISGSPYFSPQERIGRNIAWGVREHAMCGCANGMALHGGLRPYTATFFVFTDYARPAIRLAALMKLPVIYVMTHDSLGVGEDGPTHQPVEHLASFRAMPGMTLIRPADAVETAQAWALAMTRQGPTMLVLTRQNLPVIDRTTEAITDAVHTGAYIIAREQGAAPDLILIATGSEVHLALDARTRLAEEGIDCRVVSMPSWELFRQQPRDYRNKVLPPAVTRRLAMEAGSSQGWREWVGDAGVVLSIDTFGASAPAARLFAEYGFAVDHVAALAHDMVRSSDRIS